MMGSQIVNIQHTYFKYRGECAVAQVQHDAGGYKLQKDILFILNS